MSKLRKKKMPSDNDDKESKDNALPRISRSTKFEKFEEDMIAHLEACGLDEGWDSDNAPSDTELGFYPDARTAEEIEAEVIPHTVYRSKVPGLLARHEAKDAPCPYCA